MNEYVCETTDERREVSRKLRMLDVDGIEHGYELLEEVADCIGDEGVKYGAYERFAVLLADLIEPSEPKVKRVAEVKVDGEQLDQLVHDAAVELTGIDRDALLALTRWLDARATDLLKTNSIDRSRRRMLARKEHAMDLMIACGLIREALGVES